MAKNITQVHWIFPLYPGAVVIDARYIVLFMRAYLVDVTLADIESVEHMPVSDDTTDGTHRLLPVGLREDAALCARFNAVLKDDLDKLWGDVLPPWPKPIVEEVFQDLDNPSIVIRLVEG